MTKRLFVAIPLSKYFRDIFAEYQARQNINGARWTAPKNLHITVYFLGDTDENMVDKIVDNLHSTLSGIKAFSLEFEKILFAPPARPPRMIWAVFNESEEYKKLVDGVYEALEKFAVSDTRHKEYIPHVTLARFKNSYIARGTNLQQRDVEDKTMEVSSCDLMESELTQNGSIYKVIKRFSLD